MSRTHRAWRWSLQVLVLAAAALVAPALSAQRPDSSGKGALTLRIRESETGRPVGGAQVLVGSTRLNGFTDDSGRVVLAVAAGHRELEITALGYTRKHLAVTVPGGGSTEIDVRLDISAIPLKGVDVPAARRLGALEREGFYQRQRYNPGTFMWGDQLAARVRKASYLADLVKGLRGFTVRPGASGTAHVLVSTRGVNSLSLSCYPAIYLDGVDTGWEKRGDDGYSSTTPAGAAAGSRRPTQALSPSATPASTSGRDIDLIVAPGDVAGIEAYAGAADAPIEYRKNPCGTVLIWTRRGP